MFRSYLLIAIQNLKNQPGFSAIKIFSLAIGLGCSMLVVLHVQYDTSYDKHFPNGKNIYRLVTSLTSQPVIHTDLTADPYGRQMLLDYPQIEKLAKIRQGFAMFAREDEPSFNRYLWAEQDIIDIFSLQFISGDSATALVEPNSLVLSETAANKYFPDQDPLGKSLSFNDLVDLNVTGVIQDLPDNTHIDIEMMVSVDTGRQLYDEDFMGGNGWVDFNGTRTYISLPDQAAADYISADLVNFVERNLPDEWRNYANNRKLALYLEPLEDIYLSHRRGYNSGDDSRFQMLIGMSIFAGLILVTSCINYGNLTMAQIQQRAKEVGVRKTLGATRGQLLTQLLFESTVLTLLSLMITLPFVYFSIPAYTAMTFTGFTQNILLDLKYISVVLSFVIVTGLASGMLPALALSKHEPASIINGTYVAGKSKRSFGSVITVIQFCLAGAFIMIGLAVNLQIKYLLTMELGFNHHDLITINSGFDPQSADDFNYQAMLNELSQHSGVLSVAAANSRPPNNGGFNTWRKESDAPDEGMPVRHYTVNESYLDTMQFELLAGRNFNEEFATDFIDLKSADTNPEEVGTRGIIITRDALNNFGFTSAEAAVGEILFYELFPYRILGVVEEFSFRGGTGGDEQKTNIMRATQDPLQFFMIRIDPEQSKAVLEHLDAVWERHRPEVATNRDFFEATYNRIVDNWTRAASVTSKFSSIITVLISAFGLYALAYYSTQRRTKEVGIRKVLGAHSKSIVGLLTWDFIKPVCLACVLSWFVGYYSIRLLFSLFSSSAEIPLYLYPLVSLCILIIAAITVSSQCLKAAKSDPVESLRYE